MKPAPASGAGGGRMRPAPGLWGGERCRKRLGQEGGMTG